MNDIPALKASSTSVGPSTTKVSSS